MLDRDAAERRQELPGHELALPDDAQPRVFEVEPWGRRLVVVHADEHPTHPRRMELRRPQGIPKLVVAAGSRVPVEVVVKGNPEPCRAGRPLCAEDGIDRIAPQIDEVDRTVAVLAENVIECHFYFSVFDYARRSISIVVETPGVRGR